MKSLSQAAYNIQGQPMFKVLDEARKLEAQGQDMIHLEIGDPDFDTPTNIRLAAIQAISNGDTHYCSSYGLPEFREAVRTVTERSRGFKPDLNQVLITPGANVGIFYAVFCLVNPGEEVIIPDPGFPTYTSVINMVGAVPVSVPLKEKNEFRMNPADIEAAITDRTRLIIINSPQNPTGSVMTAAEMKAVYDLAEKYDLYVYSDEIYSRMNYEGGFNSPSTFDQCKERIILSNGFSKAFAMTGWRLGVTIGPAEVIERMATLLQTTSSCVSPFLQQAGLEAITGNQDQVYTMMDTYRARRDLLVNEIGRAHV